MSQGTTNVNGNTTYRGLSTDRDCLEDLERERDKIAYDNEFNDLRQEMEDMLMQMDSSRFIQNPNGETYIYDGPEGDMSQYLEADESGIHD